MYCCEYHCHCTLTSKLWNTSLYARRQGGQLGGRHHDPPLVEHRGEDGDHEVGLDGVVVLGQVPVLGDGGQVEAVGGVAREHLVTPGHVECQPRHGQPGPVHAGQE